MFAPKSGSRVNSTIPFKGRWCALYSDECEVVVLDHVDTSKIKSDDRRRQRLEKLVENARTGKRDYEPAVDSALGNSGWIESDQETVFDAEDRCNSDDEYFKLLKKTYVEESNAVAEMINRKWYKPGRVP